VFGREIEGGLPAGSVLQTINVDRNPRSSHFFNVKGFGAKADGQTDDSKVRSQFFLSLMNFLTLFSIIILLDSSLAKFRKLLI
jgi:hypothetical protein